MHCIMTKTDRVYIFIFIHQKAGSSKEQTSFVKNSNTVSNNFSITSGVSIGKCSGLSHPSWLLLFIIVILTY